MEKTSFEFEGRRVWLYGARRPRLLCLQPVDEHDASLLDAQWALMEREGLALAAFSVKDWNRELSPWEAAPVFGDVPFGGGAADTLSFLTDDLLPELSRRRETAENPPLCLGGYSLAGLFALWAASRTGRFSGVAAASPSVWFPGWLDWARAQPLQAGTVYLSLGDREERTRNPVMAAVGNAIREQYALLQPDHRVTLEWNRGNHFQDSEKRSARAFAWAAERLLEAET